MKTYSFTKKNGQWYINLPVGLQEYNETEFTLVEHTGGALDAVAHGECHIRLHIDTKPMKNAVVLELKEDNNPAHTENSCYQLRTQQGEVLRHQLGIDNLSLFMFGEFPDRIYLRKK